ncbi:transposase [bacterium]|nr:transposase [bacterium]
MRGCWAHARRKFYEAQDGDRERALVALAYIGRLYQVEKRGREDGLSPADLCATPTGARRSSPTCMPGCKRRRKQCCRGARWARPLVMRWDNGRP